MVLVLRGHRQLGLTAIMKPEIMAHIPYHLPMKADFSAILRTPGALQVSSLLVQQIIRLRKLLSRKALIGKR